MDSTDTVIDIDDYTAEVDDHTDTSDTIAMTEHTPGMSENMTIATDAVIKTSDQLSTGTPKTAKQLYALLSRA